MAAHIPGPLYYEEIGATGLPMIFLHSTPDDHRLWMYQTAHFSSDYRCLAVDCAGYGRSPAVQPGITIDDHAEACWEIIDRYTKGGAIIHGNSFGSEVAMHMAQRRPERVPALILSGCGYVATSEIFLRWAERYRNEGINAAARAGAGSFRTRQSREQSAAALRRHGLRPQQRGHARQHRRQ